MGDPRGGALRLVRALALALTTVALAAVAHLLAGGDLPAPLLLAGVLVAAVAAAHAATARRVGPAVAVVLLGAGQLLLHTALALLVPGSGAGGALPAASAHSHGVRSVHGGHGAGHGAGHDVLHGAAASGTLDAVADASGGLPMLLAHAVATVLVAAVLAGADASLWLLLAWLAPLVPLLVARAPRVRPLPAPSADVPARAPHQPALCRATSRRGPPRAALAPA